MVYTADLAALRWQPRDDPKFVYGFCRPFPALARARRGSNRDNGPPRMTSATNVGGLGEPCALLERLGLADLFGPYGRQGFRAFAVANLDDDPELELWSIDHENTIEQLRAD